MNLVAINTSGWESFLRLLSVVLIFAFVLFITYACTTWIAKYQKGIQVNKNIRVIETYRLTNNKFIQIVEVGTVCLVIAICKDTVTLLCELEKEDLIWKQDSEEQPPMVNIDFQEILKKFKDKLPGK